MIVKQKSEQLTGGLAIWRDDEYILTFLFAVGFGYGLTIFKYHHIANP